jgi:hypothetical protein
MYRSLDSVLSSEHMTRKADESGMSNKEQATLASIAVPLAERVSVTTALCSPTEG